LLLTSVAAMGAMARIYLASRSELGAKAGWIEPAILWTAIAASVLLKGPLVPMFVGLAIIVLSVVDKSARLLWLLRTVAGVIWLVVLVSPWFVAIIAKSGTGFFVQAIGHDMLDKVASSQEAHGAPPGYYFLLFWVTFWPGAVLAGLAAPIVWRFRHEPRTRFLLAWLLPSWLGFEGGSTQVSHLVLSRFPAHPIV